MGWVQQETCITWGVDAPRGRGTFGVSDRLKSIVKYRILGLGKRVSCVKTGAPILTISTSYDVFLRTQLPLGGRDNAIFSGVNFLNRRLIP